MKRRFKILASALMAAASPVAFADTWLNSTGNGSWSVGTNWLDGTAPTPGDTALFPSPTPASNVVNLTSATTVNSLQFDDSYTLQGTTALTATAGITVAAGQVATINTPLQQSDLNKNGAGTLELGASNPIIGYLNINAGTLRASSDANLGTLNNTIKLYGTLEAAGTFSTSKYINLLGGNFRVLAGNTFTLAGNGQLDSGGGTFAKDGDGTMVVAGYMSRMGTTTVNAGTMRITSLGQPGYGGITVAGGATLDLANKTFGGVILNNGSTLRGSGGASSATNVNFGSGDIFATLTTSSASDTLSATFMNAPATANSVITIAGPGTVTPLVNGSSFFQGRFQVSDGTLRFFGNTYLGPNTAAIVVNSGGTVLYDGTGYNRAITLNNGSTLRGKGTSGTGQLTIADNASVAMKTTAIADLLNLGGTNVITGGAGATITVDGPGSIRLLSSNNYSGGWIVNSGTLRATGGSSLGTGTSAIAVNGGVLEMQGVNLSRDINLSGGTLRPISDGNIVTGVMTVAAGANVALGGTSPGAGLTIGDGPNDLTGGDANTYIHVATNGGRVTLAQPSNIACNWLIDGGVLQVSDDAQLGAAANTVALNLFGTLRTIADANYARDLSAQGGTIDSQAFTMGLQNISGAGFTKFGLGTLQIDQVRATSVNLTFGTVKINHDGTAAATSKLNTLTFGIAATLDLTNNALVLANQSAGSWDGSAYTGAIGMVANGKIVTSETDAASGLTALVVMNASDAGYNSPATFRGVSIVPADVLIAYTWGGDANLDGELNGDDYFAIDSHILQSGSVFGYHNGDFDYNGEINGDDYFVIDSNILFAQGSPPFPTGLAAVPEPAALGLILCGIVSLRRRRHANFAP